jgi:ribosomal protein S18 acetylase RimI-like enzyme
MLTEISYYCDKRPEFFEFISNYFKVVFTEKSFNDPNLSVHAIQDGYDIAAVLIMKKKKEGYRITFIHVAEKYQRQGIGDFLLSLVNQYAFKENQGPVNIVTRVKADNLPSLNFFINARYKFKTFEWLSETVLIKGEITTTIKPAYILTYDYRE